jgi:hypothetical protein
MTLLISTVTQMLSRAVRMTMKKQTVSKYCDVLPSNASVICGFWMLCSVYWVSRQAELQLTKTLSILLK